MKKQNEEGIARRDEGERWRRIKKTLSAWFDYFFSRINGLRTPMSSIESIRVKTVHVLSNEEECTRVHHTHTNDVQLHGRFGSVVCRDLKISYDFDLRKFPHCGFIISDAKCFFFLFPCSVCELVMTDNSHNSIQQPYNSQWHKYTRSAHMHTGTPTRNAVNFPSSTITGTTASTKDNATWSKLQHFSCCFCTIFF